MNYAHHDSGDRHHHVGPFLTWVAERREHRQSLLRTSRRERKALPPLEVPSADIDPRVAILETRHQWLRFWAPQRIGWWIGVLFAIGGAMGTWPEMPVIRSIDESHAGWIFFVGSLFFTAAGYLQWLEAINGDVADAGSTGSVSRRWLFYGWRPRNIGYVAVAAQLIGMLFFNLSTADAFIGGLDWVGKDMLEWTPNMIGSICFLVASHAAVMEVSHRYWTWQFRNLSWWIANVGTFAGAVCFLVAGRLLIPEQFEKELSPSGAEAEAQI